MLHLAKVASLVLGCVICCQSIRDTLESVSGRRWLDIGAAYERDGLWRLWIFEVAVPEVRLSDKTGAHRYCGPGCHAGEVGR